MTFKPENDINYWIRIIHPEVLSRLGHIRHVLFDFDGTLSVLRQGWEDVMVPVMIGSIVGNTQPTILPQIELEVRDYVDRSTGILTIYQMEWLVQAVSRYGLAENVLSAPEYKRIYLNRLMVQVNQRIQHLKTGQAFPSDHMVAGAREFVGRLSDLGTHLYLASGTDHADVVNEASALGFLNYFNKNIYGALDDDENHAKERVIQRILDENNLAGDELLVVGDGPVEIREGVRRGALTLGVASDEINRSGWNEHKVTRLHSASADLLIPDFSHCEELISLLLNPSTFLSKNT